MAKQLTISATISCLLFLTSCIGLRLQTIRGPKPVWLSKSDDATSLGKLTLFADGKTTPGTDPRFVQIDPGDRIYITDYTEKRCRGRDVFLKIQVKGGTHAGTEGWICGDSTTHRKILAWNAM